MDFQKRHILDLKLDDPWYSQAFNDQDTSPNNFRGDPMHPTNVTEIGNIIGTENKVDFKALVHEVRSSFNLQSTHPEMSEEEVEKLHPLLGW